MDAHTTSLNGKHGLAQSLRNMIEEADRLLKAAKLWAIWSA